MSRSTVVVLAGLAAALAGPARADVLPPPEVVFARHARLIVEAGFTCDTVVSAEPAADQTDLRDKGLVPSRVVCGNGKVYVVATPPRVRPKPYASVPEGPPPPAPVVRPAE